MYVQGREVEDTRSIGNKRRYLSSSPFRPHQSRRECERRVRQMVARQIRTTVEAAAQPIRLRRAWVRAEVVRLMGSR